MSEERILNYVAEAFPHDPDNRARTSKEVVAEASGLSAVTALSALGDSIERIGWPTVDFDKKTHAKSVTTLDIVLEVQLV